MCAITVWRRLELETVLIFDSTIVGLQLIGLGILVHLHILSASTAYLLAAAVSLLCCLGWFVVRRPPLRIEKSRLAVDWLHNWQFGKWALGSQLVGCGAAYLMPWIVAGTHGTAATGLLAACVTVVNMSGMFVTGVSNYLGPKAARSFASGGVDALRRVLSKAAILYLLTVGGFCLCVVFSGDLLARTLFGTGFAGTGSILAFLALNMLVSSLGIISGNGLWAIGQPRSNFAADACTLIVTLIVTVCLIYPLGVLGAAIAIFAGSAVGTTVRTQRCCGP